MENIEKTEDTVISNMSECKCQKADVCPPGEELVAGTCKPVSVTLDINISEITATLEAATGKTIMRISGVAFHQGMNKNNWSVTREGADSIISQMEGADLTLHHPTVKSGNFTRNMNGEVEEAVVGVITEATVEGEGEDYSVRYVAEVHREELFASLESGLWLRPDYGVSIGGTGVPEQIIESVEDGSISMVFGMDFQFDHLAIVHRPAYPDANIETVEKIEVESTASEVEEIEGEKIVAREMFNNDLNDSVGHTQKVNMMTDDIETNEASVKMAAEMEALKAEMVLREARITEFEDQESKRGETSRLSLVSKASEIGLKGHDDFSADTLTSLIASWESSRPEPKAEVSMEAATPAATAPVTPEESNSVVANYLNGQLVKSDENLYERAWNAWASAYNKSVDREAIPAPKYIEAKEMI